ncbi:MAG TPA: hypothetical protein DCL41_07665 [Bdellovibrionales bacterium]|nr:hypothetical protein [Pseudobdellovibrionaceae bacterium]HAG91733.1 hypothetical protein [Bdellovibrionales bacterium]
MMRPYLLTVCIWCLFFTQSSFSKVTPEEANSRYDIVYGSPSWNKSPTKIESAFLVIRDRSSKKLFQVHLEETAPDSSEFKGTFQIEVKGQSKIVPEVYIPPQSLRGQMDQFYKLISQNKVFRKPVIIKRTSEENIIDVYDTKNQAQRAWDLFQERRSLRGQAKVPTSPSQNTPKDILADAAALEAQKTADKEMERLRLEQIEKQRIEEQMAAQKKLSEAERKKRMEEANRLAAEAMAAYEKGDFVTAEAKFKDAASLDPENKSIYYRYGVSLYKNEKYNEALVAFNLAETQGVEEVEKNYFMGLSHYRLEEWDKSVEKFKIVAASNDEVMAPSAHFYIGAILFKQEKYEECQTSFETVLDTSKDPKLDERAEEYIEAAIKAHRLKKLKEKKFHVTGTAGLMYDSNVLLAPDLETTQGSSLKESDVRLLTMGDLTYKAIWEDNRTWDVKAGATLMNSSKSSLAQADPWLYSLSAPFTYTKAGKLPSIIAITPGYESLFMAESGNSTKKNILNSAKLKASYMRVMQTDWFSEYSLEYRLDSFSLASSTGDNDLSSNKYTLGTTQTVKIGPKRKEALAGSLKASLNQAKGKEKIYQRYETGITYARPVMKDSSWATSLNYYILNYVNSSNGRKDNNITVSTSFAQPLKEWFTWSVVASYSNNSSTVSSSYAYDRYSVMTTGTFTTAF